jgi:hypothetical protein
LNIFKKKYVSCETTFSLSEKQKKGNNIAAYKEPINVVYRIQLIYFPPYFSCACETVSRKGSF